MPAGGGGARSVSPTFLGNPKTSSIGGHVFKSSKCAVLRCGEVNHGDILYFRSGSAGRVVRFFEGGDSGIVIEMDMYDCVGGGTTLRSEERAQRTFEEHESVLDSCIWYYESPSIIKLCLPPAALFT